MNLKFAVNLYDFLKFINEVATNFNDNSYK